jgi:hypothetical protein
MANRLRVKSWVMRRFQHGILARPGDCGFHRSWEMDAAQPAAGSPRTYPSTTAITECDDCEPAKAQEWRAPRYGLGARIMTTGMRLVNPFRRLSYSNLRHDIANYLPKDLFIFSPARLQMIPEEEWMKREA